MASTSPQKALALKRDDPLWVAAASTAALLPHVAHLPVWISVFVMALIAWRLMIWSKNRALPARMLLVILAILAMLAASVQYQSFFGREVGVAILAFLMGLKLLEMRTRRDALSVVMLGFFLLLTHYFYSQSIPIGIWLLACCFLLIATLVQLYGGPRPYQHTMKPAAALLVQSVPIMLILWVLFPRIPGPIWGVGLDAGSGITRLTQDMSPGSISNLAASGAIAFRVQFFSGNTPEQERLYWRGPVLDRFDGRTWTAHPLKNRLPTNSAQIQADGEAISYSLTLEPHNLNWILPLDLPTRLPQEAYMSPSLDVLIKEPVKNRTRFDFVSTPSYTVNVEEFDAVLRQALAIDQERAPRAAALADQWRRLHQTPEAISAAALRFFRQENFTYTLRPSTILENPVDGFLFESRRGFCEHFASAYVVLMRLAGVPARVVIGYQGGEINPVDGLLTVRQSDSHAWAEIWVAGKGWLRIDPTAAVAPSRIERSLSAAVNETELTAGLIVLNHPWLKAARNRWEAANSVWNQWVLGYDSKRQRGALQRLGLKDPNAQSMILLALGLILVVLGATLAFMVIRKQRASQPDRLWSALCTGLRKRGIDRNAWEGPLQLADKVARIQPELLPSITLAAQAYARLKYGRPQPGDLQKLKSITRQLKLQPS